MSIETIKNKEELESARLSARKDFFCASADFASAPKSTEYQLLKSAMRRYQTLAHAKLDSPKKRG